MAKQRSFGDTGSGPCSCWVSRGVPCLAERTPGNGRRGGQWALDWEGTPSQESGQRIAPGSLPSSSPHPQQAKAPTTSSHSCCEDPSWLWFFFRDCRCRREGPQCRAQHSPQTHPCSAHPALTGRHKEGVGLCPRAQECLGKSTVTQGSSCGPGAMTMMGDPQDEEPSYLGP